MRTPLLVLALFGGAFVLGACGDASGNSSENYRAAQTNGSDDSSATDPTAGQNNEPAPPPSTTAPPAAPTTPGTPAMDGTFAATVDNAAVNADLGNSTVVNVTVTPAKGFTGALTLSVTGLPTAGVTAKFDNASLDITGTTPVTAKLTLAADLTAQADTLPLVVTATAGTVTSTTPVNFKVNPQLTMNIPLNIAALKSAGYDPVFGTAKPITAPKDNTVAIVVKVINLDSAPHILHGNGSGQSVNGVTSTASFPHGSTTNALPQNGVDPTNRSIKAGNTYNGYMHDLGSGSGTGFNLVVSP